MYYDLCPWQFCGCPFCVAAPSQTTIRPTPLTTSTLFPRQEVEPTTTTESFTEDTTTAETTAADSETITTTDSTTTEQSDTESPTEETEEPTEETEEPQQPVTEQPPVTRRTTIRNPTTNRPQSNNNCPTCICNTWSQRVHRWHGRGQQRTLGNRISNCPFCGQSWISLGSFSRKPDYERLRFNRRPTFNRWSRWNQNRWSPNNFIGGGGGRSNVNSQVEVFHPPRRSFNQLVFSSRLLFG